MHPAESELDGCTAVLHGRSHWRWASIGARYTSDGQRRPCLQDVGGDLLLEAIIRSGVGAIVSHWQCHTICIGPLLQEPAPLPNRACTKAYQKKTATNIVAAQSMLHRYSDNLAVLRRHMQLLEKVARRKCLHVLIKSKAGRGGLDGGPALQPATQSWG